MGVFYFFVVIVFASMVLALPRIHSLLSGVDSSPFGQEPRIQSLLSGVDSSQLGQEPRIQSLLSGVDSSPLGQEPRIQSLLSGVDSSPLGQEPRIQSSLSGVDSSPLGQEPRIQSFLSGVYSSPLGQELRIQSFLSGVDSSPHGQELVSDMPTFLGRAAPSPSSGSRFVAPSSSSQSRRSGHKTPSPFRSSRALLSVSSSSAPPPCTTCCPTEEHTTKTGLVFGYCMVGFVLGGLAYLGQVIWFSFQDLPEWLEPRVELEPVVVAVAADQAKDQELTRLRSQDASETRPESDGARETRPTRLETKLDVHIRELNKRVEEVAQNDTIRRLTHGFSQYFRVMKAIGAPIVAGYLLIRIIWPSFEFFGAKPWSADLEALNRAH